MTDQHQEVLAEQIRAMRECIAELSGEVRALRDELRGEHKGLEQRVRQLEQELAAMRARSAILMGVIGTAGALLGGLLIKVLFGA